MYRRISTTTMVMALLAAFALPGNLLAQPRDSEGAPRDAGVSVRVHNGNWLDMRVYAVRENGAAVRIGTVTSLSTRTLDLPNWMAASSAQIRLIAVPIGSNERYYAPPVFVSAGDVIEWRLANNLALSSIFVKAGWAEKFN